MKSLLRQTNPATVIRLDPLLPYFNRSNRITAKSISKEIRCLNFILWNKVLNWTWGFLSAGYKSQESASIHPASSSSRAPPSREWCLYLCLCICVFVYLCFCICVPPGSWPKWTKSTDPLWSPPFPMLSRTPEIWLLGSFLPSFHSLTSQMACMNQEPMSGCLQLTYPSGVLL